MGALKGPFDKKWCANHVCGSTDKRLDCCIRKDSACCLCPAHDRFDEILVTDTPKEEVCCVVYSLQQAYVKPYCLSGEQPFCKGFGKCCCCSSRYACPYDNDVPQICAAYFIKCCNLDPCGVDIVPCAKLPPLAEENQAEAIEVEEATMSDEYLLCGNCCCICSMCVSFFSLFLPRFSCLVPSIFLCGSTPVTRPPRPARPQVRPGHVHGCLRL